MGSVRRNSWRQYLVYLILNVAVSAITVLIVLSVWDSRSRSSPATPTATVDVIARVATSIPTATPTLEPTATPVTYMVRSGDTLLDIALKFGISLEELMAANDLENPDALSVGDLLVIPIEGPLPEDLITPSPRPSGPRMTVTPLPTVSTPSVVIIGVEGAGNLQTETVRLENRGGEVSMAGWTLDDGEGNTYKFPAFTFYSTGAVDVHSRSGTDTSIDLYWGLNQAVWTPGKVITLRNAAGDVQSTFQIP